MKYRYEYHEGTELKNPINITVYDTLEEAMVRLSLSAVQETLVSMTYDEQTGVYTLVTEYAGLITRTLTPIKTYVLKDSDGDELAYGLENLEAAMDYVRDQYAEEIYQSPNSKTGFIGLDNNNISFYYYIEEEE